jgi:hypothetical protein
MAKAGRNSNRRVKYADWLNEDSDEQKVKKKFARAKFAEELRKIQNDPEYWEAV